MSVEQTKKSVKSGEIIMRQGAPGDRAYIIEEGRVEIAIQNASGVEQVVGTRGPGTMIGEMALVDKAPRTATIRALEDCKLLEITDEDFTRRLDSADPILRMTTQVILTRYRDTLTRSSILHDSDHFPPAETVELSYAQTSDAIETVKIGNEFQEALHTDQVRLHYQPIIDLQKAEVSGFEALMRWEHPEKGFISPNIFIPVIEDNGFIVQASQWALKESLMALKRIEGRTGYENDLFMSVNFSSRDFASDAFVDSVYATISESDVNAKNVHLEITERLLMGQPDNAKETLEMCTKAGMSISIDDFGTGYSSLGYLHYFPIDTLKIDRSFVNGMLEDDSVMALVKSIVGLTKNMKLKCIAEGVETKEQAAALRDMGCEMAQGYYFAKPLSEVDVTKFVQDTGTIAF
ncbi:MAG: EAL domain-containing protein [Bdellovibrionales bacterium]